MKCQIDGASLQMTERKGVEIDYCPECRGVWLDRGELDKILERSMETPGVSAQSSQLMPQYTQQDKDRRPEMFGGQQAQKRPERKESFLSELFDFF